MGVGGTAAVVATDSILGDVVISLMLYLHLLPVTWQHCHAISRPQDMSAICFLYARELSDHLGNTANNIKRHLNWATFNIELTRRYGLLHRLRL